MTATERRVLHLLPRVDVVDGGAERVLGELAAMPGIVPGVGVSCPDPHGTGAAFFERLPDGCPVFFGIPDVTGVADLRHARRVASVVERFRPDICHVHLAIPWIGGLLPLALRRGSRSTAIVLHDHLAWEMPPELLRGLRGKIRRQRFKIPRRLGRPAVDRVIAVSTDVRDVLTGFWGVPEDLVSVIANATVIPEQTTVIRENCLPATIVTVGALREQKRMDLVVETAALLQRGGLDFTWHVLGHGPLGADLEGAIAAARLDGRVILEGQQADVGAWLLRSDLFALFSDHEGLCLAVLEALSYGVPTLLTPGARGSLSSAAVRTADPEPGLLATAIRDLLDDGAERRRLAAAGRQLTVREHSLSTYLERIAELYDEVMVRHRTIHRSESPEAPS